MGWSGFILAFAAFFLTHAVPVRPPVRPWLVARLGRTGFTLAYSALSLAVLGWLIVEAGRAPYVELWEPAAWQRHLALAAMLPVCLLAALAVGRPNPFSFGGPRDGFDPARPGVVRWVRHPLLVALAVWAAAHIVPNGDLAHAILFGGFAAFALAGQVLVNRRRRRELGQTWADLDAQVRAGSLFPRPASWPRLVLRLAAGGVLYAGLIGLHPAVFGVGPLS